MIFKNKFFLTSKMKGLFSFLLIFVIASPSMCAIPGRSVFNVVDFGAKGDGRSDDSNAFSKAWQAVCGATQGTPTLIIPRGKTFLLQPVLFQGPCKSAQLNVQLQGTITPPANFGAWVWPKAFDKETWVTFQEIKGLIVNGGGKIDGNGASWWKSIGKNNRPTALRFFKCDKLSLSKLTHINSPKNHISINSCNDAIISDLNIIAPDLSPNTDGIDISDSSKIFIRTSNIGTGDDCVAINTGSTFINIIGVLCGPGHGISVGSLGKDQSQALVEQVTVRNCTFTNTQNGVRIKTWQGGSGYARHITFDDIIFKGVKNPVIIDQHYTDVLPHGGGGAVKVSDVTYNNVRGTSNEKEAIQFLCDSSVGGCTNIILKNVNIAYIGKDKTYASCDNAKGLCTSCNPVVPCLSSN